MTTEASARLNRIKTGYLTQQGNEVFSLTGLNYDDNGNIQHLNRSLQSTLVDDLTYSYANGGRSNRLASVSDGGNNAVFAKSSTYDYDKNGNLVKDSGKGITSDITYNYLCQSR